MAFTRAELESFRDAEVPDLLAPVDDVEHPSERLRLLFVGINPGLWTAATQTHFAHPGNRFWPALRLAGVVDVEVDRGTGFGPGQREALIERGIGITNLARRATARADELSRAELRSGFERLHRTVASHRPRVVAVAGITAWRTASGERTAVAGRQEAGFEGAALWIVPNPSGLNAHETVQSLAEAYAAPAREAGLLD